MCGLGARTHSWKLLAACTSSRILAIVVSDEDDELFIGTIDQIPGNTTRIEAPARAPDREWSPEPPLPTEADLAQDTPDGLVPKREARFFTVPGLPVTASDTDD